MKIISWNVAGFRACHKKGLEEFFDKENADIYCFQETKMTEDQNPMHKEGYKEYLYPAEKKGYSGVMIYTKVEPVSAAFGMGDEEYDSEGRVITLEFEDFYLVNCYVPNAKRGLERLDSRMRFEDLMRDYLLKLTEKKNVVYCGDLNVAHEPIDLKHPKNNEMSAGYTIEERNCFSKLLDSGFVDTFRELHPNEIKYSWWSYIRNARATNAGWRIDYFVVSKRLLPQVIRAEILNDIYGSDHCPIELDIKL